MVDAASSGFRETAYQSEEDLCVPCAIYVLCVICAICAICVLCVIRVICVIHRRRHHGVTLTPPALDTTWSVTGDRTSGILQEVPGNDTPADIHTGHNTTFQQQNAFSIKENQKNPPTPTPTLLHTHTHTYRQCDAIDQLEDKKRNKEWKKQQQQQQQWW